MPSQRQCKGWPWSDGSSVLAGLASRKGYFFLPVYFVVGVGVHPKVILSPQEHRTEASCQAPSSLSPNTNKHGAPRFPTTMGRQLPLLTEHLRTRGFTPRLIASCDAVFGWYHWKVCSFLKGSRGAIDLGKGEVGEGLWGGERGDTIVGTYCMRDKFKNKISTKKFKTKDMQ